MPDLIIERHGHVTVLTLNRPDKHNAINEAMREAMTASIVEFNLDPNQHVAVVTGAGPEAFCSGFDLVEMAALSPDRQRTGPQSSDLFGLGSSPKPILAAVNGLAAAGGLEISLNCDIRIAADNAWFGTFEVSRGLVAGIAANLLPRVISPSDAMYLLLTADRVTAEDALRVGLVQKVVPAGTALEATLQLAEKIGGHSQVAVQASKRVVRFWQDFAMRENFEHFRGINQLVMLGDDSREGARAFAEKRPPKFENRWPSVQPQPP